MEGFTVASLEAPITIKIPRKKLEDFKKELREIQDTLEHIVKQMGNMGKVVDKNFKSAGKHLKFQNIQQNKFIDGVKQSNDEQEKNNSQAKRTSKIYGDWADKLAQVRVILGLIKFTMAQIAKLVLIPAGFFAGFTFLAARVNAAAAEMINLSEATGFSVNDMRALGLEAKKLGFNFEHVNSLAEELNNKLGGEAGGFVENNLREGISALNIEVEKMQKLKPAEQFSMIMNASQDLIKKGKMSELASSFDKIFGQEGNRLLTSFAMKMSDNNQTFEEFIGNARKYTTMSDVAIQGSKSFTESFNAITESIKTLSMEFFGRFGKNLEPFFKTLLKSFENAEKNFGGIFGDIIDLVTDGFIDGFKEISKVFDWLRSRPDEVIKALKGLIKSLKQMFQLGINLGKVLTGLLPTLIMLSEIFLELALLVSDFLSNDIVREFLGWASAIGVVIFGFVKLNSWAGQIVDWLFKIKVGSAGAGSALEMMTATGTKGIQAMISKVGILAAKFAAAGAAGFAIGTLIREGLDAATDGGFTEGLSNFFADSFFGRHQIDSQSDVFTKKTQALIEQMNFNRERLAQGSIGSTSNVTTSTNNAVSNSSIQNTIYIQDPVTGESVKDQIFNGRP